jgi:L-alanine-DL-glutamate epimerase-like enolase superfamily enzyme
VSSPIRSVDVFGYRLTYVHGEYVMSRGRRIAELASTVVRVTTEDAVEGFGEVCPLGPAYLPQHAEGARAALREVAPAVLGLDVENLAAVNSALDNALAGHGYAKSALDIACWDAYGRTVGRPVHQLLGGLLSERFPLYFAVPLGSVDEMAAYVAARRSEGIHRFQLKLGAEPLEDAERTRRVVEEMDDDDIVVADANGGWGVQDAVVAARALEPLPRVFLEQPCATLEECLIVRERTTLPMVLDESIFDVHTLLRAYAARAMEAINLKVSKVGGLTAARLIRDLAQALGLRLTIEDTWGGDLVTAAVAHLAASTRPDALFSVSFMNDWTNEHVAGYQPRSSSGFGAAPMRPGLGVEVDVAALGEPLFRVGSS